MAASGGLSFSINFAPSIKARLPKRAGDLVLAIVRATLAALCEIIAELRRNLPDQI
jgi:hypothetical protein